ncbi:MAG: aminotransferase class V-fold PLP-dependent enzyme [Saprospiraceae bacterium]
MIELKDIKSHFPIFQHHPNLVYLDNAATTQKPKVVIDAISNFYQKENANIHRGIYPLAVSASQKYEQVRGKVAQFLNAKNSDEIVYTNGTTASINLVAHSFLRPQLKASDEVIISAMEHHANLIPWQMACKNVGAVLRVIPMNQLGELDLMEFKNMLSNKVKMVAITHISNSLGTINPIEEMIELAHQNNIPVLVDGAQSVAHYPIDLQALDVDFFTFSGHKLFGPTGIGVLYGKKQYLNNMQPYQFGGDMIKNVTFEESIFADAPQRFEAGTTNIAGVIGLGVAIDFVNELDRDEVLVFLKKLENNLIDKLLKINDLNVIGQAKNKSAIISFSMKNIHPHDIATFLGTENIAVRAGHHCTQPVMDFFQIPASIRVSFSIYNQLDEIDFFVEKIKEIKQFFG